jgi:hypothetical protein
MINVIVTLTTIPERLESENPMGLQSVIFSLLNQTYKNYKIHFNIPHINKKNNREYIIPTWLDDISKKSVLKIFRTEDYGSITKIYPTIKRIDDPEQIIITVDDDLVYESRLIEEHVRLREINDDKTAIGFAGLNNIGEKFKDARDRFVISVNENVRVGILEHYKSVSYIRKMFESDFDENYIMQGWADDELVSAYMGMKEIKKIVAHTPYIPKHKDQDEWRKYGVVESFPVIRHASNNSSKSGCNLWRNDNVDKLFNNNLSDYLRV